MEAEFDKTMLNEIHGLSCIENFLLYAMKVEGYGYKHLYHYSHLSLCDIADEFIGNNARYTSFQKVRRLQELAAQNGLIEMKYLKHYDFERHIGDHRYTAVMVKPEYIAAKYKTELWRNDHFLLIRPKNSESYFYLNDNPRDSGIISLAELKSIYAGEMIGFTVRNKIGEELQGEFLQIIIDSVSAVPVRFEFDLKDVTTARDILGITRVLRKRVFEYCGMYIPVDFCDGYIPSLDRVYASIEYMRLRKAVDFGKINRQFEGLQERDIEILSILSAKMKEVYAK